jgi:bifunctional UDP-N-acetylglucosamine pyrophosphorylase/glucosamine-1-phosphate N-acetyltransferase
MSLHIIILAAGQGKRMLSTTPKVLHSIGGESMLKRVVDTALQLKPDAIHVVIGHGGHLIQSALPELSVDWVVQTEQLGTGHAVMQALPQIPENGLVLVLSADVPLIQLNTLQSLIQCTQITPSLGLLLASVDNPYGLGRILRNAKGEVQAIVEEKDATLEQRAIHEIYSGICCARAGDLKCWLPALNCQNAQGEYYLTDIIARAVAERLPITSLLAADCMEIQGVNNRAQLQQLERIWQARIANALMHAGVTLADAKRLDVRGTLDCGTDVFIDVNNVFEGHVIIGDHCTIGSNCVLTDVTLGANCIILPNSVLDGCIIGDDCRIGPFARMRPGTILGDGCKIGNFVETKKAVFDVGSQASHLSYLGDVTIGKRVNIGAGTITCNYDGVNKHQTVIKDGAFIGSDTQLVAPVTVGENATIGAGSTIRKNAPAGELTLSVSKQQTIYGWSRPTKADLKRKDL